MLHRHATAICSIAPLTHYANNQIFQELSRKKTYFTTIDERINLDMRTNRGYTGELEKLKLQDSELTLKIKLKTSPTNKMRLHVWGYSQGEYFYLLTECDLTIKYKSYGITKKIDIAA